MLRYSLNARERYIISLRVSFTILTVLPARTIIITYRAGSIPDLKLFTVYFEVVITVLAYTLLGWKRS